MCIVVSIRTLVLWYFGKFCQRTTKQHPSILYRPNETQKLHAYLWKQSLFTKNDSLYYKLRCNVIATLAHWVHGIDEKVGSQEVAIFWQTATNFGKIVGAQRFHVPFCLKMSPRKKKTAKTVQNEPKLRESCAPWQKLRACKKTRKLRKSCAPQHRNFLGGLLISTKNNVVFTARCTRVQSAVLRSHVVCPSVCLSVCDVRELECDHIGWNSSKIMSRLVILVCSLSADPNSRGLLQGEHQEICAKSDPPLLIWASEIFDRKLRPNGYR